MINQAHIDAVLKKSRKPSMIARAANFLADQARRNLLETRHKARLESAVYVRTANNAATMKATALELERIATNLHPTCEYCGRDVLADRMLCDDCNDQFADVSF